MALSQDQRAMLQLLLERGQSYEDIASLLGVGTEEVRSRARAALEGICGQDPDREVALTDYLLGQADPIGRADAVRHLQRDPDSLRLASDVVAQLRLIAPEGSLPQLPGRRARRGRLWRRGRPAPRDRAPAAEAPPAGEGQPVAVEGRPRLARPGLSRRQQQVIAAAGGLAVIVVAGVLAVAGVFSGAETDEPAAPEEGAAQDGSETAGDVLTRVRLRPPGGGAGSGEAVFGLATGDQPYVDVALDGLPQAREGHTYVIWFLLTERRGYPLSPVQIRDDGSFSDRFPIPSFALPIASRARFVDISLSENDVLARQLPEAVREGNPVLRYAGDSVLRGRIPADRGDGDGG